MREPYGVQLQSGEISAWLVRWVGAQASVGEDPGDFGAILVVIG